MAIAKSVVKTFRKGVTIKGKDKPGYEVAFFECHPELIDSVLACAEGYHQALLEEYGLEKPE